jgi:hypothetical protein
MKFMGRFYFYRKKNAPTGVFLHNLCENIYSLQHDKVQGIEYIEKVFHSELSAFSRIKQKRNERKKRIFLNESDFIYQRQKANAERKHAHKIIIKLFERCRGAVFGHMEHTRKDREHTSAKSVIYFQKEIDNVYECYRSYKKPCRQKLMEGPRTFFKNHSLEIIKREEHHNGKREGYEHAHIKASVENVIHRLANRRKPEYHRKIPYLASRILASLRYHKSKYRESEPSDYPENGVRRKEKQANVVAKHRKSGDYLKHIAA